MYDWIVDGRPYYEYKTRWLWKRVDVDKAYWYQCVDLFKHYMKNVLWINIKKSWNANEIRRNKYRCFDKNRWKFVWTKNLMQWDIIVSLQWQYWHIAIFDHVDNEWAIYVLEQNWSWSKATNWTNWDEIRIHKYNKNFRVWIRRNPKIMENYAMEVSYANKKLKDPTNYIRSIRTTI